MSLWSLLILVSLDDCCDHPFLIKVPFVLDLHLLIAVYLPHSKYSPARQTTYHLSQSLGESNDRNLSGGKLVRLRSRLYLRNSRSSRMMISSLIVAALRRGNLVYH